MSSHSATDRLTVRSGRIARVDLGPLEQEHLISPRRLGLVQLVLSDRFNNSDTINVKMDEAVFDEKSSFKMLGLPFSCKLDWGSYSISITQAGSKKDSLDPFYEISYF